MRGDILIESLRYEGKCTGTSIADERESIGALIWLGWNPVFWVWPMNHDFLDIYHLSIFLVLSE